MHLVYCLVNPSRSQSPSGSDDVFDPSILLGLQPDLQAAHLATDPAAMVVRATNPNALPVEEQSLLLRYEKSLNKGDNKLSVFRSTYTLRPPFTRDSLGPHKVRRRIRLDVLDLLGHETNALNKTHKHYVKPITSDIENRFLDSLIKQISQCFGPRQPKPVSSTRSGVQARLCALLLKFLPHLRALTLYLAEILHRSDLAESVYTNEMKALSFLCSMLTRESEFAFTMSANTNNLNEVGRTKVNAEALRHMDAVQIHGRIKTDTSTSDSALKRVDSGFLGGMIVSDFVDQVHVQPTVLRRPARNQSQKQPQNQNRNNNNNRQSNNNRNSNRNSKRRNSRRGRGKKKKKDNNRQGGANNNNNAQGPPAATGSST